MWKKDLEAMKVQVKKFQDGLRNDEDLIRLRDAHLKLGQAIESGLVEAGDQALMEQAMWFWQDLFRVYLPRGLSMMKDIPIPRTEFKDSDSELVLENLNVSSFYLLPSHMYIRNITDIDIVANLDVSSFNLLPSHMYVRNITDIDIVAPASAPNAPMQPSTKTQLGTLNQLHIQAIQFAVSDISFYFEDKTPSVGPSEFTGLLSFTIPPKGINVNVKMRLIPASATTTLAPVMSSASRNSKVTPGSLLTNQPVPAPLTTATNTSISQRSLHRAFHVIETLEVRIIDDFELDVEECNHSLVVAMFKPIMALRLKAALEGFIAGHFRQLLEGLDGTAYDVLERAEVFKDTGLGSGAAISASIWSDFDG